MFLNHQFLLLACVLLLTACQRNEPPPDLIKTQREALEKAKGVEQTLQKSVDETNRKIEQDSKP